MYIYIYIFIYIYIYTHVYCYMVFLVMFSLGITTSKTYEEVREGEKQEASGIEK